MNCDPCEFEQLFAITGYDGFIGLSDATHFGMISCASWARIFHLGHKLNIPSHTYNATVSHFRQILGTIIEYPVTFNDKTIVLYDKLIRGVHNGLLFDNYEFNLYEHDTDGKVVYLIGVCGSWLTMDIYNDLVLYHRSEN